MGFRPDNEVTGYPVSYSHSYGKWHECNSFEKIGDLIVFQSPDGEVMDLNLRATTPTELHKWIGARLNNALNAKVKIKIR